MCRAWIPCRLNRDADHLPFQARRPVVLLNTVAAMAEVAGNGRSDGKR
jgi:hypothetical protein